MAPTSRSQSPSVQEYAPHDITRPFEASAHDLTHFLKKYAQENPESAALWCLGIGFILGWKLKPW